MPKHFHHIGIIGKYGASHLSDTLEKLIAFLEKNTIRYTLDCATMPPSYQQHSAARPLKDWSNEIDLAITIGGDGTFLYAARHLASQCIPLIGINAGRLGFLADIAVSEFERSLTAIFSGNFHRESRQMIQAQITGASGEHRLCALNEIVIHKRRMARMIEVAVAMNDKPLCQYRADGVIFSTPTGSTAYALSAGGPIIAPDLPALLIVPVCPHTLTQRPLVVSADSVITLTAPAVAQHEAQLTLDGQQEQLLNGDERITISLSQSITILRPEDYPFQARLRDKLNWGSSPRIPTEQ